VAEHLLSAAGPGRWLATHYHELNELAHSCSPTWPIPVVIVEETGDRRGFLHRFAPRPGPAAVMASKAAPALAGVAAPVVRRARQVARPAIEGQQPCGRRACRARLKPQMSRRFEPLKAGTIQIQPGSPQAGHWTAAAAGPAGRPAALSRIWLRGRFSAR